MTPKVAIIILNYQAPAATLACLASLEKLSYPKDQIEIHVVDNASGDHSVAVLRELYPEIPVYENEINTGYAAGNNLVIRQLLTRQDITHFWILNNDCEVHSSALTALMDASMANPLALIGSVIRYPDNRFQRIGRKLKASKTDLIDYPESCLMTENDVIPVESLIGCSWLIPANAFRDVGLLPEQYFLYFEDNAFCFDARAKGWQCLVATQSTVYHDESLTTKRHKPLALYYYHRGRFLFFKQCCPQYLKSVLFYNQFRLLRTGIRALYSKRYRRYHNAIRMALRDFENDIQGCCPHTAELL